MIVSFFGRSKSYCPYCVSVKSLLNSLGAEAKIIELDEESEYLYLER